MIINAVLYPGDNKTKSKCKITECNNHENCDLYKRGQCVLCSFFPDSCPYGSLNVKTGYTTRAQSHYQWMKNCKSEYEHCMNSLSVAECKLARVGDYVYLPYAHMTMNRHVPFLSYSSAFTNGRPFIKNEDFTIQNVVKLCSFRPQALMGGEITSYQKEEVPKFIRHLSELMPDFFKELAVVYPRVGDVYETYSNVGRKAVLQTLNTDIHLKDIYGATWHWDGEHLSSTDSRASFMLVNNPTEVKIKPKSNSIVKISDDEQVNKNTEFVD